MRTKKIFASAKLPFLLLLWVSGPAFAGTNELSTALSKALFEEEANHDLGAAIRYYQSAIEHFDTDRKLAATAVFRLGECYRKQGSTNQATAQYQRVLHEFTDQTELVTLSRRYLVTLGGANSVEAQPGPTNLPNGVTERLANVIDVGEISRVQAIIQNSPDLINAPDASGQTLLQTYAGKGDLPVVELLLKNGAAVNGIKQPDLTPLHFAAGNGRKSVVEFLLSKGAKPDSPTGSGVTPLHLAVLKGYEQVARVLLDAGSKVNAQVQKDTSRSADSLSYTLHSLQSPLHLACQEGYGGLVDLLVSKGADVNIQDSKGSTPLTVAAMANNESIVSALLSAHADPNARRASALALAAGQGNLAMLDLLLSHGTNLNLTGALEAAVQNGRPEVVTRLIQSKANPNSKYENGEPLASGALNSPAVLKALLDGGADPNQRSLNGQPLVARVVSGPLEVLELLLSHGADASAQDAEHGYSALHYAVANAHPNAARTLIKHGANVNAQTKTGETPLHFAVRSRREDIATLLLDNGADPNLRDYKGQTPFDIAKRDGAWSPSAPLPMLPGAVAYQPDVAAPKQLTMQDLLLQHGASLDLPRMDEIEVRRFPDFSSTVFSHSTDDLNRFSVLEFLAVHYGYVSAAPSMFGGSSPVPLYSTASGTIQSALVFPNLDKMEIRRPKAGGKEWIRIPVSVQEILDSGNCARDVWLQWGDQVEIPEADHPLGAVWVGFSDAVLTNLQKCVQRTVQIIIKGQRNALSLEVTKTKRGPGLGSNPFNWSPPQFCLVPALQRSGLLRTSSDMAHIKVKRHNTDTGESWEKTFDCSGATPLPSLWLRDGDVIEVPDKP
jgi:ankyrin repeat protein